MKTRFLRVVAAATFAAALLFLIAGLCLLAPTDSALAQASSRVQFSFHINQTQLEYDPAFLKQEKDTYYLSEGSYSYALTCNDLQLIDLRAGLVGTEPSSPVPLPFGNHWGWEFGEQKQAFDVAVSYYTPEAGYIRRTLQVRPMRQSAMEGVWYDAGGTWTEEQGSFTPADKTPLTLICKSKQDLVLNLSDHDFSVVLNGVSQHGTFFSLQGGQTHMIQLSHTGAHAANVQIAVCTPLSFSLDYDQTLGSVQTAQGETLPAGDHTFARGTPLSLRFIPHRQVPSTLLPSVMVDSSFVSYTLNQSTGTEDALSFTLERASTLRVQFMQPLPMPLLTLQYEKDGRQETEPHAHESKVVLTDASNVTLSLPAWDDEVRCTFDRGASPIPLPAQEGKFSLPLEKAEHRLTFTLSRTGYLPVTLYAEIFLYASIARVSLCPDNVYEQVYRADGTIATDYVLYAQIDYADGSTQRIPLSHTPSDRYVYESQLINQAHGISLQATLTCAPATFAQYCADVEAFQQTADIETARTLLATYAQLFAGRTQEERAFALPRLPVAAVCGAILAAQDPITLAATATWQMVEQAFAQRIAAADLPVPATLTCEMQGVTLQRENFTARWKGGEYPLFLEVNGERVQAGSLHVGKQTLTLTPAITQLTYGDDNIPFLWKRDLNGLLPNATEQDFSHTYYTEAGERVPAIQNAGSYTVRITIVDPAVYQFASGAGQAATDEIEFRITIQKRDISDAIRIQGIANGGTVSLDGFALAVTFGGYRADYRTILRRADNANQTEQPQEIEQAGAYQCTVLIEDPNYCGSYTISFTVVDRTSEATQALDDLLAAWQGADDEEQLSLLLSMREIMQRLPADTAQTNAAWAERVVKCNALWKEYTQAVQSEYQLTPTAIEHSATTLALINAIATLAAALPTKFFL